MDFSPGRFQCKVSQAHPRGMSASYGGFSCDIVNSGKLNMDFTSITCLICEENSFDEIRRTCLCDTGELH